MLQHDQMDRRLLMRALHLLYLCYTSNSARQEGLALTDFYNRALSEAANLQQEYVWWRRQLASAGCFGAGIGGCTATFRSCGLRSLSTGRL